ncbi:MAG: glycoside hydrolase family 3 C-terminal domain-containing protein [Chitinophagaceae bacterium]
MSVAYEMAKQSIVLLKNKNQLLPLVTNKYKTIALIGPMVKDTMSLNGEWAGVGKRIFSEPLYLSIIKNPETSNIKFLYAKGCNLNDDNTKGFNEVINIVKQADMVICAMGEDFNMSGEVAARASIQLPGVQRDLLKAIKKIGKPVFLVLMNGRPLELSWEDQNIDAIVEWWYLGRKSGSAIADVLFGKYNPSGNLVMTFPRSIG